MAYTRESSENTIPLQAVPAGEFDEWLKNAPPRHRSWLESVGFEARAGSWQAVPNDEGRVEAIVFGMHKHGWLYQLANLATGLPQGKYQLVSPWSREQRLQASVGWGLAAYRFDRYKQNEKRRAELVLEEDIADEATLLCEAQCLVRDLVNTPTEDMGPEQLTQALQAEADRCDAVVRIIVGDDLLAQGFPAIHAVGRAADREPRFAILEWGNPDHPLVALAGKGVCFDTGGLDIKTASGMRLMKKDMGGAAHVIALARMITSHALPVRLMVLIPAVENSIAGNAYRPGDVIPTRKGKSVEIGNTDAEGRVVLSDALAFACEQEPDLVMDFATLTGAARVAMGPDVPPIFSNRKRIARGLVEAGENREDPLWELPLYRPYRKMIKSEIADLSNIGKSGYGGCITAALFLQEFVEADVPWVHFDTFAWNQASRPGRPAGGEALGLRAAFQFLRNRYS